MNKRIKKKKSKSIGIIKKVKLNENDTIVVECKHRISLENYKCFHQYLNKLYPKNKILILQEGMKLGVISELSNKRMD